ncbi:MAG: hypothetical protein ACE5FU_05200, partial [Nitrospinota bacterium]
MKRWIRWPGLVLFAGGAVLIAVFFILFADTLIRKGIEEGGTRVNGAKVDLKEARLSLNPLPGLTLKDLAVTNPDSPMENTVQIKSMVFRMDFTKLFHRKFVVDEASIQGIRFGSTRQTTGAVSKKAGKEKARQVKPPSKGEGQETAGPKTGT